jgi:hypothetical protein
VLEFVVTPVLSLILIGVILSITGRAPWFFTKNKEITEAGTYPNMGTGDVPCVLLRGVMADPPSPSPIGTRILIQVSSKKECTWRGVIRIDGKIVAWSSLPKFDYVWDTAGYSPGKHVVSTQFMSPWLQPSAPVTRELTYLLVDRKEGTR